MGTSDGPGCPHASASACSRAASRPIAAAVGAVCWALAHVIGGAIGVAVVFAILVAAAVAMWRHSRKTAITAHNVNEEWQGGLAPAATPVREPVSA